MRLHVPANARLAVVWPVPLETTPPVVLFLTTTCAPGAHIFFIVPVSSACAA